MTDRDPSDGLAPVTPLFGRRGGAAEPSHDGTKDPEGPAGPSGGSAPTGRAAGRGPGTGGARDAGARVADPDDLDASARLARVSAHWASPDGSDDRAERAPSSRSSARSRRDADAEQADDAPETLDAQRRRAENVSMHALTRRGVSSAELARVLRDRDLDEEVVADEVARLERVGLLDDAQLARDLVEVGQRRKGLGRQALAGELRQRGLAAEVVEAALDDIDDDDEQGRADEWARKRASSLRGLDRETAERRLNGYLQRRGYRGEVVRRAVERALPRGGSRGGGVRFE